MIVFIIINFLVLSLVLFKVKQLEKDVESMNSTVSSIIKVLRTAYIRKKTRL